MGRFRYLRLVLIIALIVLAMPATLFAASDQPTLEKTFQGTASATANGSINVRSGPGSDFWIIDVLNPGETVPILGVSPDGGWWFINTAFTQGWVSLGVVTASNTAGVAVRDPGPSIVASAQLNVRSGPGEFASSIGTINAGDRVFLLGQNADGSWLNVRTLFGVGWISASFTPAGTSSDTSSLTVTSEQPTAIVNAQTLNVRSGPGVNFSVIGQVNGGDQLPIIGTNATRDWFNVQTVFGEGWVSDLYVVTRNEFGSSQVTTDSVDLSTIAGPIAIVNAFALNARSGPGAQYTALAQLSGGDQYQILGNNSTYTWLLLDNVTVEGTAAWVNIRYIIVRGDVSGLPILDASTASTVTRPSNGENVEIVAEITGPIAFVATGAINVRSGPNVAFEALGFVYAATRMPIVGQSADGRWWQVDSPFGTGWVVKSLIIVENDASNVPVVQ